MERYKPKNLDTLDPHEVLDAYKAQEEKKYVSTGSELPKFSARDNVPKNYGLIPHTEAEFKKIQAAIMAGEDDRGKCKPEIFDDEDGNIRWLKACMVNLYYDYKGSWEAMRRDPQCVTDATLRRYWQDAKFRLCIKAFDDIFTLKARAVITDLFESTDERVRLEAATRWLRANDPHVWDAGVQRQVVANKGSLAQTFFKQVVSETDFVQAIAADPFSKLSDTARKELRESVGLPDNNKPLQAIEGEVISSKMPVDPYSIKQEQEG